MSGVRSDPLLRRPLAATAFALWLFTAPGTAGAWTPISGERPVWCRAAPYAMNAAGSADLGAGSEAEVRRGMDDWTRVSCTSLTTSYRGTTSATAGRYEGSSVIGWVESGWRHDSNAIGVTGPAWSGRCIQEADMELNGVHYTWTTSPGSGSRVNAYSIILHEGGHFYGLGHSSDRRATMYFAYSGGVSSLAADDEAGICALYPGMGGGTTDCRTTGCPSGEECVDGACRPVTGDGGVCSPCMNHDQCGGPSDYCLRYPDGGGYCGRRCSRSSDCSPDVCANVGGIGQCVRVDGSGVPSCAGSTDPACRTDADCGATQRCEDGECVERPTDRAGLGEPCDDGEDCNSGLCLVTASGGICSQSCDWLRVDSCPTGYYCDGEATGSCGSGVCLPGSPGTTPLGGRCEEDTDCTTLFCSGAVCATPCIPGGASGCPDGYTCQRGAHEGCGACKMAGDVGDACTVGDDCASRLCADIYGEHLCTRFCSSGSECPAGFECAPVTGAEGVGVCAPTGGADDRSDDVAPLACACRLGPSRGGSGRGLVALAGLLAVAVATRRRRRRGH
ncbi:MAG: matrixin family metalloprotease [Myxococcota bacterium]|nr:matrixin family metalloprotease [Myxococcota bacterium]MDW8361331.1 matrixin family metalloprotease [Myxococcales bacterium]